MTKENHFVLVTGGAGYIGCVLVPALLDRGYRVRVFDKLIFGDGGLADVSKQVEVVQGDICDFDDGVLDNIDSVIHLAALSNDPTAEFAPKANHEINVEGTQNVANACIRRKVRRFVFASSCSIYYARSSDDALLDEDAPIHPTAPYSLSKQLAEEMLTALANPDFCPTYLRKGTVFGPSPRMRYDLVVNAFARDAWQRGRLSVFNGGEMWRPLIDVRDAADAYINALELPESTISAQPFNLVHKNYRILELAHWTKYVLRDKKPVEVDVVYHDTAKVRSYRVSGNRFQRVFGYTPSRGISQAVLTMWQQFADGVATDFSNPEYYNISWLKLLLTMQSRLAKIGTVFPEN